MPQEVRTSSPPEVITARLNWHLSARIQGARISPVKKVKLDVVYCHIECSYSAQGVKEKEKEQILVGRAGQGS